MADELKRVGLVFKADGTTDFAKSLTQINALTKENYNSFKLAQSQYDKNTSSVSKLTDTQKYLSQNTELYRNKVAVLEEELKTKIIHFKEEDILAKLLYCEAGNQSWEGQVYTCSAILNFCDRNNISIWDAAHNRNYFEPAPFVDDAEPTSVQYEVIYYVLNGGRIPEICWFRTDYYHDFGTPVCKVGDHYFSKP